MIRSLLPLIFALSLLLVGCGARERTNPFDPLNPETGGKLPGFQALAGAGRVDLRWTPPNFPTGTRVRLERKSPPEPVYALVAEVPLAQARFADSLLADRVTFIYRATVLSAAGQAAIAVTDTATPGMQRAWLCDTGRDRTVLLTPDNRKVRTEVENFSSIYDVAYDQNSAILWVANTFEGTVDKLDSQGNGLAAFSAVPAPRLLALDPARGHVWVGDDFNGVLACIDQDGAVVAHASQFAGITSLALDPADGGVWVAEPEASRVTRIRPDGIRQVTVRGFQNPGRIAYDAGGSGRFASLWVADQANGQLARLTPDGQEIFRLVGYPGVTALSVEPLAGDLLIGITSPGGPGQIVDLDWHGREKWRASGPRNPVRIASYVPVLPGPPTFPFGEPTYWVADAAGGAAWKISDRGTHMIRQGGFVSPQSITVGVLPPSAPPPSSLRN